MLQSRLRSILMTVESAGNRASSRRASNFLMLGETNWQSGERGDGDQPSQPGNEVVRMFPREQQKPVRHSER